MDHHDDSDLDVAIELIFCDPDTAFAHWTAHCESWKTEIEALLPWRLDLQWYHPAATQTIQQGVARSNIHVYEKANG